MSAYGTTYSYIERAYGRKFVKGQRVWHDETDRNGTVLRPKPSHEHYVRVLFDGEKHPGLCHPNSVHPVEAKPDV